MFRIYVCLVLIPSLLCGSVYSSSSSLGSARLILRDVNDNNIIKNDDPRDYAVDLNATSFTSVLKDTPAAFAIVEFFAHWLVIVCLIDDQSFNFYAFL